MLKIQILNDIVLSMGNAPKDLKSSAIPLWEPQISFKKNECKSKTPFFPQNLWFMNEKIPYYMPHQVPDQTAEGPALKNDTVLCTVHIIVQCSSANLP
jgi:hypothetical protein